MSSAYALAAGVSRGEQARLLAEVRARAQASGRSGAIVFDLDSTLFDNRPRQARILREFGAAHAVPALAAASPEHWTSWSVTRAMTAAGLPLEEAKRLAPSARTFWRERFFTSAYCVDDVLITGARAYLGRLIESGARIVYLTGRWTEMERGTIACLAAEGAPVPDGDRVHLYMKPTLEESDDEWKRRATRLVDDSLAGGRVLAAFDNEPAHLNIHHAAWPEALTIRLATDHSGREIPVADGIPSIADFDE